MKTIKEINTKMSKLVQAGRALPNIKENLRQRKEIMNEVTFLRSVVAYLETNPTQELLQKEKLRLTDLLSKINESWQKEYDSKKTVYDRLPQAVVNTKKVLFLKDIPVSNYNQQLTFISYILG